MKPAFSLRRFQQRLAWPLLLLALAALLRFPALGTIPAALFRDELEKGYTAWELWDTGRYGRLSMLAGARVRPSEFLPAFIDVYGVRTSAIYQYLAAPGVGLFGLSAATTRLPAALAGTLAVLALFAWMRRVWGWRAAVCGAFWMAVCPWHVVFSRWAQQGITEPLWLALAMWSFEKGRSPAAVSRTGTSWRSARAAWWAASGFFCVLALYAYEVARLFLPLWGLAFLILRYRQWQPRWRAAIPGAILTAALTVPIFLEAMSPAGAARFQRISVFGQSQGLLGATGLFTRNWAAHFSPMFLFFSGDANPRHHLPFQGLMHFAAAPMILAGIIWLARRRRGTDLHLLAWLLLYPVSAAMTNDGIPHALRSIMGIPAWCAAAGIGTAWLLRRLSVTKATPCLSVENAPASQPRQLRRFLIVAVCTIVAGASFSQTASKLYFLWPAESAFDFEAPAQRLTQLLLDDGAVLPSQKENSSPRRQFWLSGFVPYAPHRLLFQGRVAPRDWQRCGFDALPAQSLPPNHLRYAWPRAAVGDHLALFRAELATLDASQYRILRLIPTPPEEAASLLERTSAETPETMENIIEGQMPALVEKTH